MKNCLFCLQIDPESFVLGFYYILCYQLYSHGISDSTLHISASSAENFRFHVCDYYSEHVARHSSSVQVADGALLVIAEDGTIGKEEMYRSASSHHSHSYGVDVWFHVLNNCVDITYMLYILNDLRMR